MELKEIKFNELIILLTVSFLNLICSLLFDYKLFFVPILLNIFIYVLFYFKMNLKRSKTLNGILLCSSLFYSLFYLIAFCLNLKELVIYTKFSPWVNLFDLIHATYYIILVVLCRKKISL